MTSNLPTKHAPQALWCALSNDPKLAEVINDSGTYPSFGHIVTAEQRQSIAQLIPLYERRMAPASPQDIETAVAKLSIAFPRSNVSDDEADVRLEQYRTALSDIPRDVLGHAYIAAIRTCRFFPTVAEIREHCTAGARRQWQLSRLKALAAGYDRNTPRLDGD